MTSEPPPYAAFEPTRGLAIDCLEDTAAHSVLNDLQPFLLLNLILDQLLSAPNHHLHDNILFLLNQRSHMERVRIKSFTSELYRACVDACEDSAEPEVGELNHAHNQEPGPHAPEDNGYSTETKPTIVVSTAKYTAKNGGDIKDPPVLTELGSAPVRDSLNTPPDAQPELGSPDDETNCLASRSTSSTAEPQDTAGLSESKLSGGVSELSKTAVDDGEGSESDTDMPLPTNSKCHPVVKSSETHGVARSSETAPTRDSSTSCETSTSQRAKDKKTCKTTSWSWLLSQSVKDFIDDSHEQIRKFSVPGNTAETYRALLQLLSKDTDEQLDWTDGNQWSALVASGDSDRGQGSIRYALTAVAFARWYTVQMQSLERAAARKADRGIAREVMERVLGSPSGKERDWEQRRRRLATHLTRGRKWSRLVDSFGLGILLKDPW